LPAIDPSDALATRWAAAALDGERLDVRWEVPQHQAEQHQEAGRQEVEQECGAAIMAGAVLDLAG
jgi:hypothetical protein